VCAEERAFRQVAHVVACCSAGKYPYDLEDDVEVSPSNRSQMMLERMEQEKYPLPSK